MKHDAQFPIRKLIAFSEDQAKRVDDFRWAGRVPSANEAVRRLIELGLDAAAAQQPQEVTQR